MKTSLQFLRCQLLSVLAFLALASSAQELHLGPGAQQWDSVAMATAGTGSPRPDWHREGSSSGEWSHKAGAGNVVLHPARASDLPDLRASLREVPDLRAITLREAPADTSGPPAGWPAVTTSAAPAGASPGYQTFAVPASEEPGIPPTENATTGAVTVPPRRPNATDGDLLGARWVTASAAPDRRASPRETGGGGSGGFLNRQVPATTRDPRGADNSSGSAPDSTPSSRVAVCLSRMDIVWIVLAIGVPVSTCSVLLTVCCMRRRKKSSGQESNLSYWNNAITMDYFSRHAVELPREIHTLESEEHDSCLPPNGDYGTGSVVLVNPFCQETLFIKRDKASAV
ncbi:transmembrane protein 108 [Phycodurus eques]|uniref:transmembrane protein 108 n=1 Tax=Phycodurus eques TaxID=693459 RepID=UPI002ACE00BF|nr:transmembrane protein 108 [Phycodurus eques]